MAFRSGQFKALSTGATVPLLSCSATGGQLMGLLWSNPTATDCYIKLYDLAAAPAPASDVPFMTIKATAGTTGALSVSKDNAIRFTNGIQVRATLTAPNTVTDNPVAGIAIVASVQ